MVLLATNTRIAKSVCYSTSDRPNSSFDDSNLDDLSVAVTLKQSNVTIVQKTMTVVNNNISERVAELKSLLDDFLIPFGDGRNAAEQILDDISNSPHRLFELQAILFQQYSEKFGVDGTQECSAAILSQECSAAILYANQLHALQLYVKRERVPMEIEQNDAVDTTASSLSMGEDPNNIAMGATKQAQNNVQDASNNSSVDMSSGFGLSFAT